MGLSTRFIPTDSPGVTLEIIHQQVSPRQQLLQFLDHLEDEAAFDMGLRDSMRRAVHIPITLGVIAGDYKPLYRGWATDLSINGVGLLAEHDVPMNAALTVSLEVMGHEPLLMPIRICYVSQMMTQTYRIGGVFNFKSQEQQDSMLF